MPDGGWIDEVGSTRCSTAGRQPGPVPAHIEIDTDAGVARWWSTKASKNGTLAGIAN